MRNDINYSWKLSKGFEESFLTGMPSDSMDVDIPNCPVETPVSYFDEHSYQGIFTYQKVFDCPSFDPSVDAILQLDGVMLKAHVYFNGQDLGEKVSGWIPVRFNLTGLILPKGNRLTVVVDSREDPKVPPFGKVVDYLTFAGIYRPVHIDFLPKTRFASFGALGSMDGHIHVYAPIENESKDIKTVFRLFEGNKLVAQSSTCDFDIPSPTLYTLEKPYLYTLEGTLTSPYGVDKRMAKVGFRNAEFRLDGFYLNGKKKKLIGLNRHQNYPYVGPAMPRSAQEEDAEIIKIKCGCNVVRTSHYPQSEYFLQRCDEIGLLVIDEIPGWQYIGTDKKWRDNFFMFLKGMVEKERGHASLIAYGVRIDESGDDDALYKEANDFVHKEDPNRQTLGVRNFKSSHCLEDVYAYNDFSCAYLSHGLDNPKTWKGAEGHPKLITEHNGHMYPTKNCDIPERRVNQALRHAKVIDDAFKYDSICGAIGWCAFDYNTHSDFGSGDHICHHGVLDIYRNPKAASYLYASQTSASPLMWVANSPTQGDNDEALLKPLICFTNCDYIEFYKGDMFIAAFTPDKKDYPHLPHAPIIIDDFIGSSFKEEGVSPRDSMKLVKALNLVGQVGMAHLSTRDILPYLPAIRRSGFTMEKLLGLYGKYLAGWGEKTNLYTLKGYRDGKRVLEKRFGPSVKFEYRYETSSDELTNDITYDVARVSVRFVDEYGSQMHYANRIIELSTQGPIDIIGPKVLALDGGDISFYVRSKMVKQQSIARVNVKTDLGVKSLDFIVR